MPLRENDTVELQKKMLPAISIEMLKTVFNAVNVYKSRHYHHIGHLKLSTEKKENKNKKQNKKSNTTGDCTQNEG